MCVFVLAAAVSTAVLPADASATLYLWDLVPVGVALVAASCAWLAARSSSSARLRWSWWGIAVALVLRAAADGVWAWLELVRQSSPFPSLADVGYLLFYPAVLVSFF